MCNAEEEGGWREDFQGLLFGHGRGGGDLCNLDPLLTLPSLPGEPVRPRGWQLLFRSRRLAHCSSRGREPPFRHRQRSPTCERLLGRQQLCLLPGKGSRLHGPAPLLPPGGLHSGCCGLPCRRAGGRDFPLRCFRTEEARLCSGSSSLLPSPPLNPLSLNQPFCRLTGCWHGAAQRLWLPPASAHWPSQFGLG